MKVKLLAHTTEPEKLVASAAKLCYSASEIETLMDNLTEEKVNEFIDRLASMGHESPFEHITFTFGIEGVSRALLAQITRHRIASYSVQSQRYVDMRNFEYVIPPVALANEKVLERYNNIMGYLADEYAFLRDAFIAQNIEDLHSQEMSECIFQIAKELGEDDANARKTASEVITYWNREDLAPEDYACRFNFWHETLLNKFKELYKETYSQITKKSQEDARFVLPNACETKIVMTMNARSLFNFFKLRCCKRAQWEICALACLMLEMCEEVAPRVFRYAGPACVRGKCPEGEMTCGQPYKKKK